jgi:hypothetical protein
MLAAGETEAVIADAVPLAVATGDGLGAAFDVVHAMTHVARSATARDTS